MLPKTARWVIDIAGLAICLLSSVEWIRGNCNISLLMIKKQNIFIPNIDIS